MLVFSNKKEIQEFLGEKKAEQNTIGFVPTMGALHKGHVSLLKAAQKDCSISVVSIFVNPTQFNNQDDLIKYPRTLENDLEILKKNGCDVVFTPPVDEIYPKTYQKLKIDLSPIDEVMEGEFRPGHFHGVASVVHRFFELLNPDKAYFGKKDFQQVAVIERMVKTFNLSVKVVAVETLREKNGLAMSSRNLRLTEAEKESAATIYETLSLGKKLASSKSPKETRLEMLKNFNSEDLELEYLEIVDPVSLLSLDKEWVAGATACIAAFCSGVRLIDNVQLIPFSN